MCASTDFSSMSEAANNNNNKSKNQQNTNGSQAHDSPAVYKKEKNNNRSIGSRRRQFESLPSWKRMLLASAMFARQAGSGRNGKDGRHKNNNVMDLDTSVSTQPEGLSSNSAAMFQDSLSSTRFPEEDVESNYSSSNGNVGSSSSSRRSCLRIASQDESLKVKYGKTKSKGAAAACTGSATNAAPRHQAQEEAKLSSKSDKEDGAHLNRQLESNTSSNENAAHAAATARSVSFSDVKLHHYQRVLGDNPSVSRGPPIALGNKLLYSTSHSIDEYESDGRRRVPSSLTRVSSTSSIVQMQRDRDSKKKGSDDDTELELSTSASRTKRLTLVLTPMQREDILKEAGYSRSDMVQAQKEVQRIKRQRSANARVSFLERAWRLIATNRPVNEVSMYKM